MRARWRGALAGLAVVVGCSAADRSNQGANDIINGVTDTAHDATILLLMTRADGKPPSTCTGTVVAPNMILTAKHCVADTDKRAACSAEGEPLDGGMARDDKKPESLLVYTGRSAIQVSDDPTAAAARGKMIISEKMKTFCDGDIAFVVLDRDVDVPVAALRLKEGPRKGEMLTAVGWGLTEVGNNPTTRRMRPNVPVLDVGPLVDDVETKVGLGRSEFRVGEAFCSGDSGGPAFSARGAVVGVVSRGGNGQQPTADNRAAGCIGPNTDGTYTQLSHKSKLVADAFRAAGHTPIEESSLADGGVDGMAADAALDARSDASPPPSPTPDAGAPLKATGTACKEDEECSSKACVSDKCRAQCGGVATCATTEECVPSGLVKVCLPKGTAPPQDPAPAPTYTNYPGNKSAPPTTSPGETPSTSAADPARSREAAPETTTSTASPAPSASSRPAPAKPNVDSSGCSAAPSGVPSSAVPLIGLGLALVAARRRRSAR